MRWQHVVFVVVVCCQLSLVTILIYLIRFCNKTPKPVGVQERTRKSDSLNFSSNAAGTAYSKLSSLNVIPTTLSTQKPVVLRHDSNRSQFHKLGSAMDGKTYSRGNKTFLTLTTSDENRQKKRLKLVVAILSAPIRFDRREGIRRTWMKQCTSEEVVCRFFTDSLSDMEQKVQSVLANESAKYGDIEFMPIPKGYNFGLRLLWLMEWSLERFEFDFYLRMDDDYFVCLKRLLFEIPFRPQKR